MLKRWEVPPDALASRHPREEDLNPISLETINLSLALTPFSHPDFP
jgi:hypothetical protein